jgi:hypothetical protein
MTTNIARTDGHVAGINGFVPNAEQADLQAYVTQLMTLRSQHPALYARRAAEPLDRR